ncbi:arginine--tRNA ligase [Natronomonas sp.]|uniref:arginine--tRNA ligase n=1 Tax=Natronomonas sp. TaxID=2184060 RepID=UPI00262C8EAF|nr:arginine--tRNA ligase [Natronomonas sp.]
MIRPFRESVEDAVASALRARGLPTDDLGIEEPPDDVASVFASSIAFRVADDLGTAPPQAAVSLAADIDTEPHEYVERVEATGPYLNFFPSESYFADTLEAAQAADYGSLPARDVSVVVEHTSANPTGPVHVGRARNPIIGDAVANLLEYAGYDVDRHYYVNDAGRQIAVFTWAYERFEESELPDPARDREEYRMVRYYRRGNEFLQDADPEAVEAAEAEIEAILRGLEDGDEETYERVSEVVDTVLGGMKACLGRLPAAFDEFVKETRFMRDGSTDDVVARLKAHENAVYENDAWQFTFEDIDKNLVFLRADGTSLYTTRDLAHHEWKFDNYDRAVTVLGEDHKLQARQLKAALSELGNDPERLDTVVYSYVNLPEGKMSTRRGTGVQLDDLLDESIDRAREEVQARLEDRLRDDDLDGADVDRIARQVGVGAVRYDIVSKQPTKAITFEWDRALDFEAQSAPYVQYVHARCRGIEAEADGIDPALDAAALSGDPERELLATVARLPGVVEAAAADRQPHRIATYTREIADRFNGFYRECPVVTASDDRTKAARLALVVAARHTVANALEILGVEAPESM